MKKKQQQQQKKMPLNWNKNNEILQQQQQRSFFVFELNRHCQPLYRKYEYIKRATTHTKFISMKYFDRETVKFCHNS